MREVCDHRGAPPASQVSEATNADGCHDIFITKTYIIMKKLLEILTDENRDFDCLPWWVYAVVLPLALVALMALAGWIDSLCA